MPKIDLDNQLSFLSLSQPLPKEQVFMENCQTMSLEFDEDGSAYISYKAPENEQHYIVRDGEVKAVGSYVYVTKSEDFRRNYRGSSRGRGSSFGGSQRGTSRGYSRGSGGQRALSRFDSNSSLNSSPSTFLEKRCEHCKKSGHKIWECEIFVSLGVKARWASARDNKLCMRCLGPNHMARDCKVRFLCDVDKCGQHHHHLLHPTEVSKIFYDLCYLQGIQDDIFEDQERGAEGQNQQ